MRLPLPKFRQNIAGDPNTAQLGGVASQLAMARNALAVLASDLKKDNEPGFQALEAQWQKFLAQNSAAVNNFLARWIDAAEQQCNELDYRSSRKKPPARLPHSPGRWGKSTIARLNLRII